MLVTSGGKVAASFGDGDGNGDGDGETLLPCNARPILWFSGKLCSQRMSRAEIEGQKVVHLINQAHPENVDFIFISFSKIWTISIANMDTGMPCANIVGLVSKY